MEGSNHPEVTDVNALGRSELQEIRTIVSGPDGFILGYPWCLGTGCCLDLEMKPLQQARFAPGQLLLGSELPTVARDTILPPPPGKGPHPMAKLP